MNVSPDDIYVLLAAVASFLAIYSLGSSITQRDKLAPRLKAIHERREELKQAYIKPKEKQSLTEAPPDWMHDLVNKLAIIKDNQLGSLSTLLIQAGYRSKNAVIFYAFGKLVMPIAGLVIGILIAKIDWSAPFALESMGKWFIVLLFAYFGTKLQDILIVNQRQKRYHEIRKALPDTLDLMLVCAEAGLSLAATLERVARELGQTYPVMAEELSMTAVEIGFLPDRNMALKNLTHRVDMQEINGMVNVLLQTEKYGTPVSQALRVLSKEFRTERMLRAEQKAARLPALMSIPLIVFILPTLFVIVLSPAIIGVLDAF